jgi:excisionase family DNA binding protein
MAVGSLVPPAFEAEAALIAKGFARVPEAAKFLGVSRSTVYLLMEQGDLVFAKFGRSRRIPWAGLHAFAEARLTGGAA